MRWLTHYPPRRRRNPWLRRFLLGSIPLLAAMVLWLRWEPPETEEPEELMGLPRWTPVTNVVEAGGTNRVVTEGGGVSGARSETNGLAGLPPALVERLIATSAPPSRVTPSPSLIVPAASSLNWMAKPVETVLEAQIALARVAYSPGSIDGLNGPRTRRALAAFQEQQGMRPTGVLDTPTRSRLLLTEPPFTQHVVSEQDLARLMVIPGTWLGKSQVDRLDYGSLDELVAERWQSDPELIRRLNQDLDWSHVRAGSALIVPNVRLPAVRERAGSARIRLSDRVLEVLDAATNRVALFPCSIARQVQDRPVGRLLVERVARGPEYTFDPARFPRSAEARALGTKLSIPAGPNNPVGTVWIGLNRPGYGIHGTPSPEQVGRAESLGCFRLANWNAELLAALSWVGMPVDVLP